MKNIEDEKDGQGRSLQVGKSHLIGLMSLHGCEQITGSIGSE